MPDTKPIRDFIAGISSPFVEIATADLLKLLDAADRPREPAAPRVPCVDGLGLRTGASA